MRAAIASNSARTCSMLDAGLHLCETVEIEIAARIFFLFDLQRHPQIGRLRETPAFRHHPDNGNALAVYGDDATNDVGVGPEMSFARSRNRVMPPASRPSDLRQRETSDRELVDSEKGKGVRRDKRAEIAIRLLAVA